MTLRERWFPGNCEVEEYYPEHGVMMLVIITAKTLLWSSRKNTLLLFNYFHHFFCLEKAMETCP